MSEDNKVDKDFKDARQGKGGIIALVTCVIIVIAVAVVYFGYKTLSNNSYKVYESTIKEALKELDKKTTEIKKSNNVNAKFNLSVSGLLFQMLEMDYINDYNFILDSKYDESNKIMSSALTIEDTKNNISEVFTTYSKDGKIYLDLGKDYYKNIVNVANTNEELSLDKILGDYTKKMEQINYLANKVSDTFLSNLNKKDFSKSKEEVSLGGNKYSLTKHSYDFNKEKAMKMRNEIFNVLMSDEKSMEYLASLNSSTTEEIKSKMEEILNEENNPETDENHLIVDVYTKGINNSTVGIKLTKKMKDQTDEELSYIKIDDNFSMLMTDVLTVSGSLKKDGVIKFNVYNAETKKYDDALTLTLKENSNGLIDVDFDIPEIKDEEGSTTKLSGNLSLTENSKEKEENIKGVLTLNLGIEGINSTIKISIDVNSFNDPVTIDVDLGKSVAMSEKVQDKIMEATMKKLNKFQLFKAMEEE